MSKINELLRIGRFRERQYQKTAQRQNEASIKFNNYRQTARYFELECDKARQFNAWNIDESSKLKNLEIIRKAELLVSRRNKLRDLLKAEETFYKHECEKLKSRRICPRVHFSPEAFNDRLKEKRAEESLYKPRTCRRIQSYLYGAYVPSNTTAQRRVFKELKEPACETRMNMEKHTAREEEQLEHDQDDYNQRQEEYKENSRSAHASNLYGAVFEADKQHVASGNYKSRPAAGLSTDSADHRPHTRRLHDSHFLLGNQTYLHEEGGLHKGPNQKFNDRYANRSLEATNVGETAGHSMEEVNDLVDVGSEADIVPEHSNECQQTDNRAWNRAADREEHDQTDDQREKREFTEEEEEDNGGGHGSSSSASMNDNASSDSANQNLQDVKEQTDELDRCEQRDIDKEFDAKASAGRSDHRHFETEKSLPWLRMIPGDKNLSEQMFLYLTHNELKGKIQDLEKRENQAASKHQWDEALRLRDMRNRLDLAREKNLYRRDDLLLDPEVKKIGMAGIEARSKLLKEREILCTNSSMYSEEAKVLWSQWLVEDQNSVLEGARLQREDLMKQLEENWRSLAIEDKQRISDSFNKEMIDVAILNDHDNLCAFRSASR